MFRWKRRNDGFEWREYVRTTILLRRGDRRRRVEDARLAAVDGVKEAGGKVASAAGSGLSAAGKGAGTVLTWLAGLPRRVFDILAPVVGPALARIGRSAIRRFGPLLEFLDRREIRLPLTLCGVIAAMGAVIRYFQTGWDQEVTFAALIAAAAGVLVAVPRLAIHGVRSPRRWWEASGAETRLSSLRAGLARLGMPSPAQLPRGSLLAAALVSGVIGVSIWSAMNSGGVGIGRVDGSGKASAGAATGTAVVGRGFAVTGDSLRVSGSLLKLAGIEAPEREQSCEKQGGAKWRCGEAAKVALEKLLRGKRVTCEIKGSSQPPSATCRVQGEDVAASLVKQGHVFAESAAPGARYAGLQESARSARTGLWAGTADRPSAFRAKRWEEAKRTAPEGCPIKGQVSERGRVYVLPWSPSYDRVKVRETRGERWFCSEEEARAAGWSARS